MPPLRVIIAATSLMLSVGACFATDSPTGMGGEGSTELAIQPALIPSPADAGAGPINRIRAVATRVDDNVVLGQTVLDVSPTAESWTVVLSVRTGGESTTVVVFVYLIHVEGGVETVEFSGLSDPIVIAEGEAVSPDIPLVRGPIDNLFVTGVTITSAPAEMVVGASASLSATVEASRTVNPEVFWTSLDPAVVTTEESTVSAVAPGVGRIVASAGAATDTATIVVRGPLTITTTTLPPVRVGQSYSQTLSAAGGDGSYTWEVTSGSLPPQLALDGSTGAISGTATNVGSATFTVSVTSGDGQRASRQLTIIVYGILTVTTSSLPAAHENVPYSQTLAASGGNGVNTWTLSQGSLPPGLNLSGSTGAITGVPTTPGEFGFVVSVASGDGQSAQQGLSIEVIESGFGQVVGVVYDAVTSEVIASATVAINGGNVARTTPTATDGTYAFTAIPPGTYTVAATADGYQQNTAMNLEVVDVAGNVVRADFALPPTGLNQPFGGLSGRVLDNLGNPLAGVSVAISGGAQTNGIFRSTTTGPDGTYALVGIVLRDADQVPIEQFTVLATRSGFATAQTSVQLIQNRTVPNVDFQLSPSQGGTLFFEDGFETATSWSAQGFWNRSTLQNITNAAVPTYVQLAPGDGSVGALPMPIEGAYAFWYGEAGSGNFMGTQSQGDFPGSGGTSEAPNAGSLTSPILQIPQSASTASLRFSTWFEIESVNPNESGYDLMTISVFDEESGITTDLVRLNPFVDPSLPERDPIPFTSGGFNAPPVWRTAYADLSAYAGANIRLIFTFDTVDGLYNGFRGWIIDDVVVSDEPVPAGAPTPVSPRPGPSEPRGTR